MTCLRPRRFHACAGSRRMARATMLRAAVVTMSVAAGAALLPPVTPLRQPADVVFVLDGSEAAGPDGYVQQRQLVASVSGKWRD
jgi:hypothetical protein